jgi:hypothetical protein
VTAKNWERQWEEVVSQLNDDVLELAADLRKIPKLRALSVGNDLGVVPITDEPFYLLIQNPAFPRITLNVRCTKGERIDITGLEEISADYEVKISPVRFYFAVDNNYEPCLREQQRLLSPSQVADEIVKLVAVFFRKVASR